MKMRRSIPLCVLLLWTCEIINSSLNIEEELHAYNYNRKNRPYFFENKAVNVTVQIFIHSIGPIDETRFTFQHGFYLRQWWKDPRLIDNSSDIIRTTSLDGVIWQPDTAVQDAFEVKTFKNALRTEINRDTGDVYISRRIKAITKCDMDLHNYPMDQQKCQIVFENYAFTTSDIEIFWHKKPVLQRKDIVLDGYKLKGITTEVHFQESTVGSEIQYFKLLKANILVKRTVMYHVYRAYIPSILLIMFTFGTFWVPDAAVPARMGMIVTSFLSNTFILQGVTEKIVRVPYTTPMQFFLLVNVVIIILTLIEYLLVLQLRRHAEIKAKKKLEKDRKPTIRSLILGIPNEERKQQPKDDVVFINDDAAKVKSNEDDEVFGNKNEKKEKQNKKKKNRSMHILDKISQVFFPLFYFLYCIVYFVYFFHND